MLRLWKPLNILAKTYKPFINIKRNFQVSVIGAASPLGQSVSLLLKEHRLISRLTMYDMPESTFGLAMDLSHVPREPRVEGWTGRMEFALRSSDIVVITGGQAIKAGQTDYDLCRENADFIISAMQGVIAFCPKAFVVIATEPINYTMPLASKALESGDALNESKILGVTGLDTMRTQTWLERLYCKPVNLFRVPVICGHSSETIIPVLSNVTPRFDIDDNTAATITERVRNAEHYITYNKCGYGGSPLSSAYATFCTVSSILNALYGFAVEHIGFVANNDYGTKYFATPLIITARGIESIMQIQVISALEADYIYHATERLTSDVETAEAFYCPTRDCPLFAKANVHAKIY